MILKDDVLLEVFFRNEKDEKNQFYLAFKISI